jgi:hypothetical protein
LGQPFAIPEIDENDTAVITTACHPSGQDHLLASILRP